MVPWHLNKYPRKWLGDVTSRYYLLELLFIILESRDSSIILERK